MADSGKAGETMALVQAEASVGTVTHRAASVRPATKGVGSLHCLVASAETARQRLLAQSAKQWGWETTVCSDPADCPMDSGSDVHAVGFCRLGRRARGRLSESRPAIADQRQVLLVVCGHDQDGTEEVWARQLGVWFYLPGICDPNTIGLLCRDARSIISQRMKAAEQEVSSAVSNKPIGTPFALNYSHYRESITGGLIMNMPYNLDQDRHFDYQNEEQASSTGREKVQRKSQPSYSRKRSRVPTTAFIVVATSGSLGNSAGSRRKLRRRRD